MAGFLDTPRSHWLRRALFQVHLWVGVAAGLYLFVVCITGASLVFRIDMQRMANPELFVPQGERPAADAATVLQQLRLAYPNGRIAGIDAPTTSRPSYLAYVSEQGVFHTVLIDPSTGWVLGELPDNSLIRTLQALHFTLLLGRTGTVINGIGALCLLTLCMTGLVIWWQGRTRWRRGFTVRWRGAWPQINWDLHNVAGICTMVVILMWGITALHFTFPKQFRAVVQSFSTITVTAAPKSTGLTSDSTTTTNIPFEWDALLIRAQQLMPGQHVARVVLPARADDTFQVLFARQQPTPAGMRDFNNIHLDQYTGEQILQSTPARTAGDVIMAWVAPLHVGSFGGTTIKLMWLVLGLAPPLLFTTGIISWWRRVVRPAYLRAGRLRASVPVRGRYERS